MAKLEVFRDLESTSTCRAGLLAVTLYCDSSCSAAQVAAARRQLEAHLQGQPEVRKAYSVRGC
jgi:hypothetical protein